tara:strand:+ start:55 stop:513 length:459 start_codon:yes stop_codon:yes gene_type:complete
MITLREAGEHDLDAMVQIALHGTRESAFEGVVCPDRAREYLRAHIHWDEASAMLAEDNGEIVGGVLLVASHEVWEQPLCYLLKFWVLPSGRGTNTARLLMSYIHSWAKENDCSAIYATATAELDAQEQKLFENLLKRSGFVNCGPTMKARIK